MEHQKSSEDPGPYLGDLISGGNNLWNYFPIYRAKIGGQFQLYLTMITYLQKKTI